jgi:purine catabolism regulator
VLSEIVSGAIEGPDMARRLEPFGLRGRVSALVTTGDDRELEEALRGEATGGLVARAGDLACALLPDFPDEELFELGERVRARLGDGVRIGAGRAVAATEARRAFHEARCALEAMALGNGDTPERLATYRDLGSFQLLLSLQDSDALALYCESLLGPIEQGEGHYGGELMRSLEAFIEANGQWEAAARKLYCHRHTLRYRIRKIEELTGRDLGSARDRIEFWLAMRGRELTP